MNKNLIKCTLISLLALPFMAGCAAKGYTETRTEEELVNELANVVIAEVGVAYSKFSGDGVLLGDTDLVTTVNEKVWDDDQVGLNFTIKYSLTAMEAYTRDYLILNEAGNKLTSVVVTDEELAPFPTATSLGGAAYTLRAQVTFAGYGEGFVAPKGLTTTDSFVGQEIAAKNWNALVKTIKSGTLTEVKTKTKGGDMVVIRGRVAAAYNWIYEEVFRGVVIADGNDGVLLYAGCLQASFYESATSEMKIHIGDIVEVYGEVSPYNGLFEVKPKTIRVVTDQAIVDTIQPTSYREPTAEDFNNYALKDTGALVKMTGMLLNMTSIAINKLEVGKHWVINLKDSSGKKFNMSVNYHVGAETQKAIKTFLTGLSGGSFQMTGMAAATDSIIDISAVMIGNTPVTDLLVKE